MTRVRQFLRFHVRGWLLLALIAASLFLLSGWQQATVDRLTVRLEHEQLLQERLNGDVNALRYEVNTLATHGQVTQRAEAELGMVRPDNEQIVRLAFAAPDGFTLTPLVGEANAGSRDGQ